VNGTRSTATSAASTALPPSRPLQRIVADANEVDR
jgi:hypothetical protein